MTAPLSEIQLLDPKVKREFLAALRSGNYAQGQCKLRSHDDLYCCLGVLTDLAVKAGIHQWEHSEYGWGVKEKLPSGVPFINTTDLTNKVLKWAGIEYETGMGGNLFFNTGEMNNLMHCNDTLGYSFEQIADIVEEHL
jgi:hypothetical protein